MPVRGRRKQKAAAAEAPPADAGECRLLLLPEDLLVAVLDKLLTPTDSDAPDLHCLLAHAKDIARAERSCSALRRSCGGVWRRVLQQHKLGYEGVELVEPTGASWKELLEAAIAQPVRLVCSAAVDAGVLPLRCRGLAAQFRGRLGSDQAAAPNPNLPRP